MEPEEYAPPPSVMNEWRRQCSCSPRYRPCDGVMAGGMCDQMKDDGFDDDDYDDYEDYEDYDDSLHK